jgi:hypothetical protein
LSELIKYFSIKRMKRNTIGMANAFFCKSPRIKNGVKERTANNRMASPAKKGMLPSPFL